MQSIKKAFFLPYILIFVFIGSMFIYFKLSFVSSMLETANLELENSKADIEIDNKYTIFKNILAKTNSDSGVTAASSDSGSIDPDNDDYNSTYSGGLKRNLDDDIDAFSYGFGYISTGSFNSQNIFAINSEYLSYSSGITQVSSLFGITIQSNNPFFLDLYLLDSHFNQKGYLSFSGSAGTNNFSIGTLTNSYSSGDTLTAFLYNLGTNDMFYRYNFTDITNNLVNYSMSVKNNGTGSYLYLGNYIYKKNDKFIIRKKYFKN